MADDGAWTKLTVGYVKDSPPPWGMYDFSKPSLVVVAANDQGDGALLWGVGGHIRMEMEEAGLSHLDDLGLNPPNAGVWVWKGKYTWYPGSYEYPLDGSMEAVGTWRAPTPAEWEKIQAGQCPWDDEDWKFHCVCFQGDDWKGFLENCPEHGKKAL